MSETTKEKAIEVIQRLPEDASFEDILHELEFFARIERGFREDAEGKRTAFLEGVHIGSYDFNLPILNLSTLFSM